LPAVLLAGLLARVLVLPLAGLVVFFALIFVAVFAVLLPEETTFAPFLRRLLSAAIAPHAEISFSRLDLLSPVAADQKRRRRPMFRPRRAGRVRSKGLRRAGRPESNLRDLVLDLRKAGTLARGRSGMSTRF
jgi:hypothetical protein